MQSIVNSLSLHLTCPISSIRWSWPLPLLGNIFIWSYCFLPTSSLECPKAEFFLILFQLQAFRGWSHPVSWLLNRSTWIINNTNSTYPKLISFPSKCALTSAFPNSEDNSPIAQSKTLTSSLTPKWNPSESPDHSTFKIYQELDHFHHIYHYGQANPN